jgi:hypothetical protein
MFLSALFFIAASSLFVEGRAQSEPVILSAKLEGKRLTVTGENFAPGAWILIDGVRQKTKNSEGSPEEVLIAKKGGKRIGNNQIVRLQVMNSEQSVSNEFQFFGGPIINMSNNGQTIAMTVGQQFLLTLPENYDWTVDVGDQTRVIPVPLLIEIPRSQGLFELVSAGKLRFAARGEPNCDKSKPPCPDAPYAFEIKLVISNP